MRICQNINGIVQNHVPIFDARDHPGISLDCACACRGDVDDQIQSKLPGTIFVQVGEGLGVIDREGKDFSPLFSLVVTIFQ